MINAYLMSWKENQKKETFSIFPDNETLLSFEMIDLLEEKYVFNQKFHFEKITYSNSKLNYERSKEDDHVWQDYPPNYYAWPIFSEEFKTLLEKHLTGEEKIDFISIDVTHFKVTKKYYILRFNKLHDVINREKTSFVNGTDHIIVPTFKSEIVNKIAIFTIPNSGNLWKINSAIYVNDNIKKEIMKKLIKGIEFSKARIS